MKTEKQITGVYNFLYRTEGQMVPKDSTDYMIAGAMFALAWVINANPKQELASRILSNFDDIERITTDER